MLLAKQPLQDVIMNVQLPFCNLLISSTSIGTSDFDKSKTFNWTIGKVEKELLLTATMSSIEEARNALLEFQFRFRVGMFTISGVSIEGLAVQNESYKPFKGGRSVVNAVNCIYRFQI